MPAKLSLVIKDHYHTCFEDAIKFTELTGFKLSLKYRASYLKAIANAVPTTTAVINIARKVLLSLGRVAHSGMETPQFEWIGERAIKRDIDNSLQNCE